MQPGVELPRDPLAAMAGAKRPVHAASGWDGGWYRVPHEVTWRDLDAVGHVNNAVYFSFFEWARTKYWLDLTGEAGHAAINFIVARAECDFRRQLGLGDRILIGVRISELRGSSFDFVYQIDRPEGDPAATGKVTVVLYSWENQSKMTIPDELRRRIETFQNQRDS